MLTLIHRPLARATVAAAFLVGSTLTPQPGLVDRTIAHLDELAAITMANGGTRDNGSPGFDAVLHTLEDRLHAAGYETERQDFSYEITADRRSTVERLGEDGGRLHAFVVPGTVASPTGGDRGRLLAPDDDEGCTADAWSDAQDGMIALLRLTSACTPAQQLRMAQEAGAVAAIAAGRDPGIGMVSVDPALQLIPTASIAAEDADELERDLAGPGAMIDVLVDLERVTSQRTSTNLIAERNTGGTKPITMAGAHLDSVAAGPGVNDNATGAAALLAIAESAGAQESTKPVRFAWWGGEEHGLRGSTHYVDALVEHEPDALARIGDYTNLDMLGSSNWVIQVGDGRMPGSGDQDADGPAASIRSLLDESGQPWVSEFFGHSDFEPFARHGIPVADVSSGAGAPKTDEQERLFGGTAGEPMDPNYHQAGDDRSNVSEAPLRILVPVLERFLLG